MKKRTISLILAACFLACLFPSTALAADTSENASDEMPYTAYSAIGDSICAGFAQLNYEYVNGFSMDDNISHSPEQCYVRLVGSAFGIDNPTNKTTYNLGKCGCNTTELLDILTNPDNTYNGVYMGYLGQSDLITLEIGSNDLLMAVVDKILTAVGTSMTHQEAMVLVEPLMKGDVDGIAATINTVKGLNLGEEDIQAIRAELADDKLTLTLNDAYNIFAQNFPEVITDVTGSINANAKLLVLNYYNPYGELTGINSTIGILDGFINQMNDYTKGICASKDLTYVDISNIDSNIGDPHPSAIGHMQIAERIVSALANCISATAQKGGTITPSGISAVKNGGNKTITIAPDSGYLVSDVKVDGASVGAVGTYTFENVTADHTISASFKFDESSLQTDGTEYYETYTALGDSITAGYSRPDYDGDYSNPNDGYVAVAAKKLGVKNNYNLGLLGYKSGDLLDALTNPKNEHYTRFTSDIRASNLITLNIGSNDLTMVLLNMIFECMGYNLDAMSPEQRFAAIRPLLEEVKPESFLADMKKYYGQDITAEKIKAIIDLLESKSLDARFADAYAQFTVNWDGVIEAIRVINPDAAIVALGYYYVGPDQSIKYGGTTYKISGVSNKYIDQMNAYISEKSPEKDKYLYVKTIGAELITIGGITTDPHPSEVGHAQIAGWLVDSVLNDISAVSSEGATASPSGVKTVAYGHTQEYAYPYMFTPTAGSTIKDVYVDGSKVEAAGGSYTFKEVSANHTISVSSAAVPVITVMEPKAYYSVTPTHSKGGSISLSNSGQVIQGSDVSIFITPDPGYAIDFITLDGEQLGTGSVITIKNISANHSVYVAFKASSGSSSDPKNPFKDIKSSDWFFEAAMYGYLNGIIKGTSDTTFDPDSTVNLAMIQTLLYQLEKEPSVTYDSSFSFLGNGKWYANAFIWSIKSGITIKAGLGATLPEDKITREGIVTLLYLFAKYKGYEVNASADLNIYADSSKVSDWAGTAMKWAVAEGLIKGTGSSQLEPSDTATRAEVIQLIYRFIEKYGK